MMANEVSTYFTYANLQMAAEALLHKYGFTIDGLGKGNDRASRTPTAVAEQLIKDGWTVVAHQTNTPTGLSATLFKRDDEFVMSIRSTEFLDDAVRDNKATNELELKASGFAIGQLADLENWYQKTVKDLTAGRPITVTGYSLGGSLATAFEQLHRGDGVVGKVYTINGAGVGSVNTGSSLDKVVSDFQSMRSPDNDLGYLFTTPRAKELYKQLKTRLSGGTSPDATVTAKDIAAAEALFVRATVYGKNGKVLYQPAPAGDTILYDALVRIKQIQDEGKYVASVTDVRPPFPNRIATEHPEQVEATNLNYQIAFLTTAKQTSPMSTFRQGLNLPFNFGPRTDQQSNIVDLLGDTYWSMVSNSQYHHGKRTPIFIEDQPEYRGTVRSDAAGASWRYAGIKLLVNNYSLNDFGDTHSLVLLQDSLRVQDALVKLDPLQTVSSLSSMLRAASNSRAQSDAPSQGQCDGDALEHAVDALVRLFVNSGGVPTPDKQPKDPKTGIERSRNEGGTWANIDDRNQNLHALLTKLAKSDAYKTVAGQVRLENASYGLATRAKTDFAALVCLLAGSTIAVVPKDASAKTNVEAALGGVWQREYELWKQDRRLSDKDREAGKANFSDEYLQSRADFLRSLVWANQNNFKLADTGAPGVALFSAKDWVTGIELGGSFTYAPRIQFGTAVADTLVGIQGPDSVYGGSGNDTLTGAGDDDWLEGNGDNDRLDGGEGDDTLLGGQGKDAYVFNGTYDEDVVVDNDDQGSVQINGSAIESTKSAGRNFWVTKTGDGKLYTLEVIADSRSSTGKTLLIKPADHGLASDVIWIRNFDVKKALGAGGYLGIKLEPTRALVIASANNPGVLSRQADTGNPFDTDSAWDFNAGNVQPVTADAAERTGQNYTIYLNQAAQEGDKLRIKVEGGGDAKLKLICEGRVIEISGEAVIDLEPGQTELGFAVIGASEISSDKTFDIKAIWEGSAMHAGMSEAAQSEPAVSNALKLTLKDNGVVVGNYNGDQRAPIEGTTYNWGATHWDTGTGHLEGGVAEEDFNDVISSNGGDRVDLMDGVGGNDALDGGKGNDQIKGGIGNDLLAGGAGHDYIEGGDGDDVILLSGTLAVPRQVKTDDPMWAPRGDLRAWAQAETWGVYDPYDASTIRVTYQQSDGKEFSGVSGDAKDTDADIVEGGAGNDLVAGSWGDDAIFGEAGDDNLRGLAGDDAMSGGDGADWMAGDGIDYGSYFETVMGADQGYDEMDGGAGNDTMSGDAKDDVLTGGAGADEMYGDWSLFICDLDRLGGIFHGDDVLDGGSGNDKISGDGGLDTLTGGLGNDTLRGDAAYTGNDALEEEHHDQDVLDGGDGNDALYGDGEADWLEGGDGDDRLQGDSKDTEVEAHGDDSLDGGAGADTLLGDGGDDWLFGGDDESDDYLKGDSDDIEGADHGADELDGGKGADFLTGDGGDDTLTGGEGDDSLDGDNSTLSGEHHGADLLEAGAGDDELTGGGKADTLVGAAGNDMLSGDATTLAQEFHGDDDLDGGEGDDTLQGQGGNDTLFGGEGDDLVAGGDEQGVSDSSTMGGDDAVFGEAGNDTVLGGLGNDVLSGGDGDDQLAGGEGDDELEGGSGSDLLMGGKGNDNYYIDTTGLTVGVAERVSDTEGSNAIYIRGSATQVDESGGDLTLTFGEGQQLIMEGGLKGGVSELYFVGDSSQGETQAAEATQANDATGFVEWLQLNFWKPVNLTAATSTSALYGGSGNDTLTASTSAITLNGGWGDDQYTIKKADQVVVEYDHGGVDTVYSDVTFTLGAAIEKLVLNAAAGGATGTGNTMDNWLIGNASNNKLYGNQGNDTLDGGSGTDTMEGGEGDDVYEFSTSSDSAKELTGQGTDTIRYSSSLSNFVLDMSKFGEVENLTLTGTYSNSATGNVLNNRLTGNAMVNTLVGGEGNDTLDGGIGSDSLNGGLGDDLFIMSAITDKTTELVGEGNDTVQFAGTVDLTLAQFANIENATLLDGAGTFDVTGTMADNVLIGNTSANTLTGNDGNDTLIGGGGEDVLQGGTGDDTYFVDSEGDQIVEAANGGTDTVLTSISWTLGATQENLTLLGGAWADLTGNAGINTLTGNDGNNVLDGRGGNDVLIGGLGDDTYRMEAGDTLTEVAGGGTDTIVVAGSLDLSLAPYAHFENLTLEGAGEFEATGNGQNNALTGNDQKNRLTGGDGNDTLDGALGVDLLIGGKGDDTYVMTTALDTVTELAGEGTDTVMADVTVTLTQSLNAVENVTLTGTNAADATGNALANRLIGNAAVNVLSGAGGRDTLNGAGGADTLKGGDGDDTYQIDDVSAKAQESTGAGNDTVETSVTLAQLWGNIENVTLVGNAAIDATGNGLANVIIGNEASNKIDGGTGADDLRGGAGDDVYVIDAAGDKVTEAADEGIDRAIVAATWTLADNVENGEVSAATGVKLTGNTLGNQLTGAAGNDTLSGGVGNDTLHGGAGGNDLLEGGAGDDSYQLTAAGDTVSESVDGGTDTVFQAYGSAVDLAANVENLTLTGTGNYTGTGNNQHNLLVGNDKNNTLNGKDGDDTLFGGLGDDKLSGGKGDDVFVVNSAGDTVVEQSGQGTDTVQSDVSINLSTLSVHVERMELTGTADIDGTGNTLDNTLIGNEAKNRLDGGAGADVMAGGDGDDSYVVDSLNDVIVETYGAGTDEVRSSISISIDGVDHVENLTLTGSAAEATGNDLHNVITGNAEANTLRGGSGDDTLDGGAGADVLDGGEGDDTYVIGAAGLQQQAQPQTLVFEYQDFAYRPWQPGSEAQTPRRVVITGNWQRVTPEVQLAAQDTIVELDGGGTDTVRASVSVSALGDFIENLELTGAGNLNGTGNTLDNRLIGTTGNNTLNGVAGNDTLDGNGGSDVLKGGAGDDTYLLRGGETVTESAGAGVDTIEVGFTLTGNLVDNVENLRLTGTGHIDGNGNGLNNLLTGNDGNNRLDGKAGKDRMVGGKGDDTYVLSAVGDLAIEGGAGHGVDTVEAGFTVNLTSDEFVNIENVLLLGTNATDAIGTDVSNKLTGNSGVNKLSGAGGNDTLDGGLGNDVLEGGDGHDTYVLDSLDDTVIEGSDQYSGTDTLNVGFSITLDTTKFANVENVTLTGSQSINATGNASQNVLTGNDGNNKLDGQDGFDILVGGKGNDTYVISTGGDSVKESAGEGTDTIQIGEAVNLATDTRYVNVENVVLTGSALINAAGNDAANKLTGNANANQLLGGSGEDTLLGAEGNDSLYGQDGNDELIDDAGASDLMRGDAGADIYRVGAASAPGGSRYVKVYGGSDGDVLYLAAGIKPEDVTKSVSGSSLVLTISGTNVTSFQIELVNQFADGQVSEVRFASGEVWSGGDLGGNARVGTDGDDDIRGDLNQDVPDYFKGLGGNDSLYGFGGDDTLVGGAGNDWLCGHDGDDVYEIGANEGTDLVWEQGDGAQNIVRFVDGIRPVDVQVFRSGGDLEGRVTAEDSLVIRNATTGAETWLREFFQLDGTGSVQRFEFSDGTVWTYADIVARVGPAPTAETVVGTAGDDQFVVDDGLDVVRDSNSSDRDTIRSSISLTLPANIERLELTGTLNLRAIGNDEYNEIVGNDGDNFLDGVGGHGLLIGGLGDDTYVNREVGDHDPVHIVEAADQGHDTVQTDLAYYTLDDNVEDLLILSDAVFWYRLPPRYFEYDRGYKGNALDNRIEIKETDGPRARVDGGLGDDTLVGGAGDEVYVVDSAGDQVIDTAATGYDVVESAVTFTLDTNLESLTLTGGQAASGTGNAKANVLDGSLNTAANVLTGLGGDDTYRLGAGDTAIEAANGGNDTLDLADDSFVIGGVVDVARFGNFEILRASFDTDIAYTILGTSGADKIFGSGDAQTVIDGRDGNDELDETSHAMSMDTLLGGMGNDTMISHGGEDWLDGGQGDDVYHVAYEVLEHDALLPIHEGQHIRLGVGSGHDRAQYDGETFWTWVEQPHGAQEPEPYVWMSTQEDRINRETLLEYRSISVDLDADFDPTSLRFARAGTDLTLTLNTNDSLAISSFFATASSSTVVSPVDQVTFGGAFITGDQMAQAIGMTSFSTATAGDDLLIAALGSSATQSGGAGNDYLAGGGLGQQQNGGGGNDTLVAGDGDDTLTGGAGDDTLCGGRGADRYVFEANWGHDVLNESNLAGLHGDYAASEQRIAPDGSPNTIVFGDGVTPDQLEIDWNIGGWGMYIRNLDTGDTLYVPEDMQTQDGQDPNTNPLAFVDRIEFANGTVWDRQRIEWGGNVIEGTEAADTLQDRVANSRVFGYGGNDTLTANYYHTELFGGDGNDTLTANDEATLNGEAGQDTLTGSDYGDTLNGGAGADTMSGGLGGDVYYFDNASDVITEVSSGGDDTVYALANVTLGNYIEFVQLLDAGGAITATGNTLQNKLTGNASANLLQGLSERDTLVGGLGNDTLDGGQQNDTLQGGLGADTYKFNNTGNAADTIDETPNVGELPGVRDRIDFGTKKYDDFDFVRVQGSNNLEARLKASPTNKFIIKDWYLSVSNKIEDFIFTKADNTGTETKTAAQIEAVVKIEGEERIGAFIGNGWQFGGHLEAADLHTDRRRIGDPAEQDSTRRSAVMTARLVDAMAGFPQSAEASVSPSHRSTLHEPVHLAVHTMLC
jgi:Ca2+-binding RTX toxin-like protein